MYNSSGKYPIALRPTPTRAPRRRYFARVKMRLHVFNFLSAAFPWRPFVPCRMKWASRMRGSALYPFRIISIGALPEFASKTRKKRQINLLVMFQNGENNNN